MSKEATHEFILRVENLSLRLEGRDILQRVNLAIRPGEVHGLLGLNGSGKSSLAYALMGCSGYEADQGQIWFAGQEIRSSPSPSEPGSASPWPGRNPPASKDWLSARTWRWGRKTKTGISSRQHCRQSRLPLRRTGPAL